jgi:hypothetical protein
MSEFVRMIGYVVLAVVLFVLATTSTVDIGLRIAAAGFGGGAAVLAIWAFRDMADL